MFNGFLNKEKMRKGEIPDYMFDELFELVLAEAKCLQEKYKGAKPPKTIDQILEEAYKNVKSGKRSC